MDILPSEMLSRQTCKIAMKYMVIQIISPVRKDPGWKARQVQRYGLGVLHEGWASIEPTTVRSLSGAQEPERVEELVKQRVFSSLWALAVCGRRASLLSQAQQQALREEAGEAALQ